MEAWVLPIDRMIEKAYDLVQKRRVEYISDGVYNVIGHHGTYMVARKIDGTVSCNCPGFARRGRCSHCLAVMMLNQPPLMKSIRREIRRASDRSESASAER